jgi:hypothetical protein
VKPEEEEELKRLQLQKLQEEAQRKQSGQVTSQGCGLGCVGLIVVVGLFIWGTSMCSNSSSSSTSSDSSDNAPASTPNPHATSYEQGRLAEKREFIQGVNESISGAMIAGNKLKYVGDDVDLHCTVDNVVDSSNFNADCGEDSDGMPAILLIQYDDTSSLDKGQAIRVLGTVEDPTEGVNGFGGETTFPTVKAEFME